MTGLKFDEKTARTLLGTAPRVKPSGVTRVYYPMTRFTLDGAEYGDGDAIVLTPAGEIAVIEGNLVNALFEPVAKRTRQSKETE